ncbi:hypothetical protein DL769_004888 [Monosporascus sp. CRB-8-3]|nr:hypothetical protein DL769_004888 [Monosporascus sp. CRB-8-3]
MPSQPNTTAPDAKNGHPEGPVVSRIEKTRSSSADSDALRLEQMGHAQELDRSFSLPAMCGLCLCLMATWEALSTVVAAALTNGGAPCLFYNYILSFCCTIAITCSLGEIASMYPTAGGQYYWVAALSPVSSRKFSSFFTGWTSLGAQIVFTASAAFAAGIIHIAAFVAVLVTLGVMAPKNSASFVFTEFTNNSGWPSDGVSWLVGLLSVVYPFLGYDAVCHMSEEIPHPERNVPIAMVGSVVINGLLGLVYGIVLLFSIGSLDSLLTTPTGFPYMQIYLDVTASPAGSTVMSLTLTIIAITATVAGIASTSRTAWALARDRAIPFDRYFSKVSDRLRVPIRAILLVLILQILLGFIYLGNTTAFNAVLSMAIIAMYLSYLAPIVCMLFNERRSYGANDYGYWTLGKPLGITLNIISIVWMTVAIVFSTFPTVMPVTAQNMNYSIVVMTGWFLFGGVYYFVSARKKFDIPVVNVSGITALSVAVDGA